MLAASAGNDALQAGFSWLCSRANEQAASARHPLANCELDRGAPPERFRLGTAPSTGTRSTAMRAHSPSAAATERWRPVPATPSPVRLSLPARARNIAVVRRALEAVAEELALPRRLVEDMRLAVTEACTNVVRHAYTGDEADDQSALRVELRPQPRGMLVVVEDRGRGVGAQPRRRRARPRAAADRGAHRGLEITHGPGQRGSRVAMSFAPVDRGSVTDAAASPNGSPGTTRVSIASGPLVGPVLRRVVGMLAARADLPLDRLDDAVLVADLIASRAPAHVAAASVDVDLETGDRTLFLRVGPLRPGGGDALIVDAAVPGVGNVIEQLADDISVQPEGESEYLHVRLAYPA